MQACDDRTRQVEAQARPEQAVDLVDRERAEVDARQALGRDQGQPCRGWVVRRGRPTRDQESDAIVVKSPDGEVEGSDRRLIEPRGIVDRDEERLSGGSLAEDLENRQGDAQRLWRRGR